MKKTDREDARASAAEFRAGSFTQQQFRVPSVDLDEYPVAEEAILLLPREFCVKHTVVPVAISGDALIVAVEPDSTATIDAIEAHLGVKVRPVHASSDAIERAIKRYYSP